MSKEMDQLQEQHTRIVAEIEQFVKDHPNFSPEETNKLYELVSKKVDLNSKMEYQHYQDLKKRDMENQSRRCFSRD